MRFWAHMVPTAAELFSRAIERDPRYARAYSGIADCRAYLYLYAGRDPMNLDHAFAASRKAFELDPDLPEAHASFGTVLSLMGRHTEAEEAFEAAIRRDPGLFEAHYFYARDCFTRGQLENALSHYQAAMRARPDDYQSPLLMAQILDDLGRSGDAGAVRRQGVAVVDEHLRRNPDDLRALYMGANGLVALGERERGLEWARRALALDPGDPMLLYNVACVHSLAGDQEAAIECLERSVASGFTPREWLERDSNLTAIRDHPRFAAILRGLPAGG